MIVWNELSGGVCSTAMAIVTGKKVPNVMVNTGGNYPWALKRTHKLIKDRYKVIVLSSFTEGYATYFDYIRKNELMPFYVSCCAKAKDRHMNKFFNNLGHSRVNVNVGFIEGEEDRAERLVENHQTKRIRFHFPMLSYNRIQCEKLLRGAGFKPNAPQNPVGQQFFKSGCFFCPKQPNPPEWVKSKMVQLINRPLSNEGYEGEIEVVQKRNQTEV